MYITILDHRPPDLYYDVWYTGQPVGKDTLENCMKVIASKGGLQGKLINHSTRKTDAGVVPNEMAQLRGQMMAEEIFSQENEYSVSVFHHKKGKKRQCYRA
jgi:hypothetical protein